MLKQLTRYRIKDLQDRLYNLQENNLPREFHTQEEWNEIIFQVLAIKKQIAKLQVNS